MKVLTILGSPRKESASTTIALKFNEEAAAKGAEVTTVQLNDLNYKGCQGCYACKKGSETCVLKDDLTPVFEALHAADAVVMTSPIYFGDVTAQLKGFIDRFYSTVSPEYLTTGIPTSRLPAGKKSLLIFTQGAEESMHAEIPPRYDMYLEMSGFAQRRVIRDYGRGDFEETTPSQESMDLAAAAAADFSQN